MTRRRSAAGRAVGGDARRQDIDDLFERRQLVLADGAVLAGVRGRSGPPPRPARRARMRPRHRRNHDRLRSAPCRSSCRPDHGSAPDGSPSESLNFVSPSRIRPLTVPAGSLSCSAISAVGEAAEVGELDHLALIVGQVMQRPPYLGGVLAAMHFSLGAVWGRHPLHGPFIGHILARPHRVAAKQVDRAVVDDARGPTSERSRASGRSARRCATTRGTPPARRPRPWPGDRTSGRRARMPHRRDGRRSPRTPARHRPGRAPSDPRRRGLPGRGVMGGG